MIETDLGVKLTTCKAAAVPLKARCTVKEAFLISYGKKDLFPT